MEALWDVGLAVFGVVASFALGAAWPRFKIVVGKRRARRFWTPIFEGDLRVVLGHHELATWEPSGLVSIGEAQALGELREYLHRLYLGDFKVLFARDLERERLDKSMVVLGGPDMNSVARDVWDSARSRWSFADPSHHNVAITDRKGNGYIVPVRTASGDVSEDFGLILKVRSPYVSASESKVILAFAGCFGYGTLAALRYAMSDEFSRQPLVMSGDELECLVSVPVRNGICQGPKLLGIEPVGPS